MLAFIQAFINIALRRSGPEDLPDSRFLLGLTLAVYLVTQVSLASIAYGVNGALLSTLMISLVLLFGGMWVLLSLTGYRKRYTRTVTAMLGTSALLSLLSMPFGLWRQFALDIGLGKALPNTIIFAIMVWSIAVDGHILARALSRPYTIGLLVAIAYFYLHTTILFELVPDGVGNQSG